MPRRPPDFIDKRLLKALQNPTRVHILSLLSEGPNSVRRIARRMPHVSERMVYHHMAELEKLACVEVIDEIPRGIGVEQIYRATERQFFTAEEWAAFDPENRTPVTATILRLISEEMAGSLETGRFDERPDNHLSRSPVEVDEQGWSELVALLARTMDEVLKVHERSGERAAASGEALMAARVVIMQFLVDRESPYEGADAEPPEHRGPPPR